MPSRSLALLLLTLVSLSSLSTGQTPSFIARQDFMTSAAPRSVAVADVNNDGIMDLIAAVGSNVDVLLGKGDGTYQPAMEFGAGDFALFVAVADLNADGNLDVAVTAGSSVSILLGNGDGTFQAPMQFFTGTGPTFIAVGDLNGDSIPDLAVINGGTFPENQGSLSVLLGNGNGSFSAATNYEVGRGPKSVAIGDFNGDGVADLVVANWGNFTSDGDDFIYVPDTTVSIFVGNGDGTFNPAQNRDVGQGPRKVIVGDFNGDGISDLAVTLERGAGNGQGLVVVLFGDGSGAFLDGPTYVAGFSPQDLVSGDFNGDGVSDLLVANSQGSFSVLLANGDGTFNPGPDIPALSVSASSKSVAVGDFNGDGILDVALTGSRPAVSIILGNGDGSFGTARILPGRPFNVTAADFNQDGIQDLAFTTNIFDATVSVVLGHGDGTFEPARSFNVGNDPTAIAAADLNGDGIPDLVVANNRGNEISILLGNGDGTFQPAMNVASVNAPRSIAIGDFNGDGIPDIVVSGSAPYVALLLGNGNGTFQSPIQVTTRTEPSWVAVGDFNGDGNLDIAVSARGALFIVPGNGGGTFAPAIEHPLPSVIPGPLAVADLNHDGIPDVAVLIQNGGFGADNVSVLISKGDGSFSDPVSYELDREPQAIAIGDVTGDGNPDIVVSSLNSNFVAVLTGNGDGDFQPPVYFGPGGLGIAITDLNNDGKLDLVISSIGRLGLALLINNQP